MGGHTLQASLQRRCGYTVAAADENADESEVVEAVVSSDEVAGEGVVAW